MTSLAPSIWLKLCVWLAVGYAIYFFYGIKNSSARKVPTDETNRLQEVKTEEEE